MTTLQKIVGGALILGGGGFLAKTFIHGESDDSPFHLSSRDKAIAVAIGAVGGFVVGLTSVGSGTFFGLAMLFAYPLTASKMVGTDMFHAAVLLWVAGISHLLHGDVDKHAIAWLLVGSIPGVLLGSHLSIRVPERPLRIGFGIVLLLSGIKLVEHAGGQRRDRGRLDRARARSRRVPRLEVPPAPAPLAAGLAQQAA